MKQCLIITYNVEQVCKTNGKLCSNKDHSSEKMWKNFVTRSRNGENRAIEISFRSISISRLVGEIQGVKVSLYIT